MLTCSFIAGVLHLIVTCFCFIAW